MWRKISLSLLLFSSFSNLAFGVEPEIADSKPTTEDSYKSRGYHFGFGLAQPTSIGSENNYYEKLFSSPSTYPEIWGEFTLLPIGGGLDLGVSIRSGVYKDTGNSALKSGSLDLDANRDLEDGDVDSTQRSRLTIIPFQAAVNLSYSPFKSRIVVFNVWNGLSYTFIENTTQASLDSTIDQSDVTPYVNSGFNQEGVVGASISFDVSRIDPSAAYSLKVYGINGIFLTPFYQKVSTLVNKVGVYDRDIIGLMFSFETVGT